MSGESGEKRFAPSAKRLRDAVARGDVLRSRDLATAVSCGAATAVLIVAGPALGDTLGRLMRDSLTFDANSLHAFAFAAMIRQSVGELLFPLLLIGGASAATTILVQLVAGDGRFVAAAFRPRPQRLSPVAGVKRMVGPHALIELGKSLAKVAVLACVAFLWWTSHAPAWPLRPPDGLRGFIAVPWTLLSSLLVWLAAGLLLLGLVDWPLERWRRLRRLMMSRREMTDEHKETDGNPEHKAALRRRQRQLARGGVAKAVAEADFVLTNPTHFAVALAYDPARAAAPVVLAKGRDQRALAMRDLAAEAQVPVLEYPELARSLYFTAREQEVIRAELYAAVARILAFVLALRRGETPARPTVTLPVMLRFDAQGRLIRA
ncbi:EscU/YscU/HrcU family type III secretion system export apparatus switch protein [Erythrobacteraceae bacterium CFH 75059]|uniref:EscU/YscU/HrcU family type III secretion system export apparatus switch protein n=1 Tax=Qipengyuania thermophila TaxID=2509361 RepID=UPI00101F0A2C|nr:EscU/YscU/HrcU family type III secretion system export apparatus switch protein [Qipengyuania thermophila]TCD06299.1 EscU/YscU/HrcU family type III secretion system export apparatus switch protein [Erythrobacteraceae bacterium CFH 75059]